MQDRSIYSDISRRTNGDIYIGVVGPVRTGKSTIIKKIMDTLVLPNIENEFDRERAKDSSPQSAGGKTVMTTEPKFIPDEAVNVKLDDGNVKIKLVDCVGYIVPEALGQIENGEERMVHTPWQKEPMPFSEAAEYGTRKVITDHTTIGLLVTTDGSIGEIPRNSYTDAEEKVAAELKRMGKPFAIVLNSAKPSSEETAALGAELEEKYKAPVALVNALTLNSDDVKGILSLVLSEFPVTELTLKMPEWTSSLPTDHPIKKSIFEDYLEAASKITKIGEVLPALDYLSENENVKEAKLVSLDMGNGKGEAELLLEDNLYYRTMSELTGTRIDSERSLIELIKELSETKKKYDKIASALEAVEEKGYGIVMPSAETLKLEEPQIIKQPGGYGVRLKASAPSIHMIKADIETEISPIVGTEAQSEELVRYLVESFDDDPSKIWQTNMFGRTLFDLVSDGLQNKLRNMPEESRSRMSETLGRIVNEGSDGLICILL